MGCIVILGTMSRPITLPYKLVIISFPICMFAIGYLKKYQIRFSFVPSTEGREQSYAFNIIDSFFSWYSWSISVDPSYVLYDWMILPLRHRENYNKWETELNLSAPGSTWLPSQTKYFKCLYIPTPFIFSSSLGLATYFVLCFCRSRTEGGRQWISSRALQWFSW